LTAGKGGGRRGFLLFSREKDSGHIRERERRGNESFSGNALQMKKEKSTKVFFKNLTSNI